MKNILMIPSRIAGFTLVEMAIVLMIVGLLLGGMLVPLSAQMEQRKFSETRKTLDEIQQALIGYAVINGSLPHPAKATLVTGVDPSAGLVDNSLTNGIVPWATLGTNETDAWGNRFTYSVTNSFTTPFTLNTIGALSVKSSATGGSTVATGIPAVIVSHGKNGFGAYTPAGQQIHPVPAVATDEGENADTNNTFVSHDITSNFDDLVVWISPNILLNRMVAAGKLP